MAGIHASTSGETIGAPMAAYTLLGGKIFRMSHDTAVLPLNQALAFLKREELYASLSRGGTVYASIYDYVYRNNTDPRIERMNYWEFTATQQLCPLSKHNQNEPSTGTSHSFPLIVTLLSLYGNESFMNPLTFVSLDTIY